MLRAEFGATLAAYIWKRRDPMCSSASSHERARARAGLILPFAPATNYYRDWDAPHRKSYYPILLLFVRKYSALLFPFVGGITCIVL